MVKIPFDINKRPEIEAGEYEVETRDGRPVRIICWDRVAKKNTDADLNLCVLVPEDKGESVYYYHQSGKKWVSDERYDLFLVTQEPELSEFEVKLWEIMKSEGSSVGPREKFTNDDKRVFHGYSAQLLALARNEIVKSGYAIIEGEHYLEEGRKNYERGKAEALKDLQENLANNDVYSVPEWLREVLLMAKENGKKEALKDLPRWKKCDPHTIYDTKCNFVVNGIGRYIILDGYMINVDRLEKLPGFKEDESHE